MGLLMQFRVRPGEEVIATLATQAAVVGIRDGAVVSLVGAIDECCISNPPTEDAKGDVLTEYRQPFELSGCGEIVDGQVHLHVSVSGEGDVARHGHLQWAKVETWFVAAYVIAADRSESVPVSHL